MKFYDMDPDYTVAADLLTVAYATAAVANAAVLAAEAAVVAAYKAACKAYDAKNFRTGWLADRIYEEKKVVKQLPVTAEPIPYPPVD